MLTVKPFQIWTYKNNIGLVLAIADYCDVEGSLVPQLSDATESIITSFVQAIIVAGLPEG